MSLHLFFFSIFPAAISRFRNGGENFTIYHHRGGQKWLALFLLCFKSLHLLSQQFQSCCHCKGVRMAGKFLLLSMLFYVLSHQFNSCSAATFAFCWHCCICCFTIFHKCCGSSSFYFFSVTINMGWGQLTLLLLSKCCCISWFTNLSPVGITVGGWPISLLHLSSMLHLTFYHAFVNVVSSHVDWFISCNFQGVEIADSDSPYVVVVVVVFVVVVYIVYHISCKYYHWVGMAKNPLVLKLLLGIHIRDCFCNELVVIVSELGQQQFHWFFKQHFGFVYVLSSWLT